MPSSFRHELTYDASLHEVAAMLLDPAFREAVAERQKVERADVDATESGGRTTVRVEQVKPTAGVPSFAKKIVGEQTTIVQEEIWSGHEAEISVTIPGKPGSARGTARLSERAGGTVETVELEVKVTVPLIAGKLEKLISDLLAEALRAENAVGRDYLSG